MGVDVRGRLGFTRKPKKTGALPSITYPEDSKVLESDLIRYTLVDGKQREREGPRILVIGAGSRGSGYARAILDKTDGIVSAVCEPLDFKRDQFGRKFIWGSQDPSGSQAFADWKDFIRYEQERRTRKDAGDEVEPGVDAALICVQDHLHAEVITSIAPLNLHVLGEKPLATTLEECLNIYSALRPQGHSASPTAIFGIGHVLRYSPHNILLRKLLVEDQVVGSVLSVEHTEPVGFWHFAHSYVRGNWRKESTSAPSLLTKSCHDIDFLLWLLCSPPSATSEIPPHHPSTISSTGLVSQFRKARKPKSAGQATNCMSCDIRDTCAYSAPDIYIKNKFDWKMYGWPVKIVVPEIEDLVLHNGVDEAKTHLEARLLEDYGTIETEEQKQKVASKNWFGRCVFECDNDVCDDQTVVMSWDDDILEGPTHDDMTNERRYAKTANFHMIAQTEAQCARRGRIYGTKGELTYDSRIIFVYDFETRAHTAYDPMKEMEKIPFHEGHGGGDAGLIEQFVKAVAAVKNGNMSVEEAQKRYIRCTLEEIVRSHAVVFAAEEARTSQTVVNWQEWWANVLKTRGERKVINGGSNHATNGVNGNSSNGNEYVLI